MARKEQNDAVAAVDERAKALRDAQAEAQRVQDESVPTPTQRENDLAKVGALNIDEKEDDKSGPDPVDARRASSADAAAPYKNRAAKSE